MIAVIAVIIVVVVVAAGAIALGNSSDDEKPDYQATAFDDMRLKIYGNANGSDEIDATDVAIVEHIVSSNSDDDETNDIDWSIEYPLADANYDGTVDSEDVSVINSIINKESCRMYYYNYFDKVTYVNYPLGQNIGSEYLTLQLLTALGEYDMLTAVDSLVLSTYSSGIVYPGITDMAYMGEYNNLTVEGLNSLHEEGVLDTVLLWTGGMSVDYFWDQAEASGLADQISFVIVPCQGPDVINGVLMLACMLGDQSLSDDYREWYDEAMDLLDTIESTIGEKKTVTCVSCFTDDVSGIRAYGSDQAPALWFNKVVNFQEAYVDKTSFTVLGSIEAFSASATDEVIVMTDKSCDWDEYNDYVEYMLSSVYSQTDQFKEGKMYVVDFEMMPFTAGPAGCYILAAYLYPELFDMGDALDFLQEYLDNFAVREGADARYGYTYTGEGYNL